MVVAPTPSTLHVDALLIWSHFIVLIALGETSKSGSSINPKKQSFMGRLVSKIFIEDTGHGNPPTLPQRKGACLSLLMVIVPTSPALHVINQSSNLALMAASRSSDSISCHWRHALFMDCILSQSFIEEIACCYPHMVPDVLVSGQRPHRHHQLFMTTTCASVPDSCRRKTL